MGALEKLLRGCKHAILDLSFESRQEFLRQHSYPLHRIPTLCVATCTNRQSSLLTPLIEYITLRYGEVCDGLVCQGDAVLPNSARVVIDDMDHFGPAWGTFPATDRYDPTRLWLSCVSLALRFGAPRSLDRSKHHAEPQRPQGELTPRVAPVAIELMPTASRQPAYMFCTTCRAPLRGTSPGIAREVCHGRARGRAHRLMRWLHMLTCCDLKDSPGDHDACLRGTADCHRSDDAC